MDMIVQNISAQADTTDLTFTVSEADLERAVGGHSRPRGRIGYADLKYDPNVVKVSVIGVGMRSHAGIASQMFGHSPRRASTSR